MGISSSQISNALQIPPHVVNIHIDALKGFKYIRSWLTRDQGQVWSRTLAGDKFIYSKEQAMELPAARRKYPDLPAIEEKMLEMMIGESEGINEEHIHEALQREGVQITFEKVKRILRKNLEEKGFATHNPMEATYGTGNTWFITGNGDEYFDERGKL